MIQWFVYRKDDVWEGYICDIMLLVWGLWMMMLYIYIYIYIYMNGVDGLMMVNLLLRLGNAPFV